MKKACDDLFPATKGEAPLSDSLIVPNYLYVRFLPSDSTDVNKLLKSDYELYNYPLDYEILGDPSDYYDSSLEDGKITWQYTAVPIDSEIPDVPHEIIDVCYIPSYSPNGAAASSNLQKFRIIEDKAFDDTGNTGYGGGTFTDDNLHGRITVYDTNLKCYQGVKGIKVRARVFLKIRTDYTNEKGYYSISDDFIYNPRFELRFENKYGFKEGYGLGHLVLPTTCNMKNSKNLVIDRSDNQSDSQRWWALATINNAAYDWFKFCSDNDITVPANNLRIWALGDKVGGTTIMLHHGMYPYTAISDIAQIIAFVFGGPIIGIAELLFRALARLIGPDILICGVDAITDSKAIYETTCHEIAHATHFQQLGNTDSERCQWWAQVFNYELATLQSPTYGDASTEGNGPCGVTEMWAYVMGYYMQNMSYKLNKTVFPIEEYYWFKPDALWDLLIANYITPKQAADCLIPSVTSVNEFKEQLIINNPAQQNIIEKTYEKYK